MCGIRAAGSIGFCCPSTRAEPISEPATDHLEIALEATCAALITLEALRLRAARPGFDASSIGRDLAAAAESLRDAIEHLRRSSDVDSRRLAFEFVVCP